MNCPYCSEEVPTNVERDTRSLLRALDDTRKAIITGWTGSYPEVLCARDFNVMLAEANKAYTRQLEKPD